MSEEKESRWFLIEHKKCGSILTLRDDEYSSNETPDPYKQRSPFVCPSCLDGPDTGFSNDKLTAFLKAYRELSDALKPRGFTIREISPDELEAMKKLEFKLPGKP